MPFDTEPLRPTLALASSPASTAALPPVPCASSLSCSSTFSAKQLDCGKQLVRGLLIPLPADPASVAGRRQLFRCQGLPLLRTSDPSAFVLLGGWFYRWPGSWLPDANGEVKPLRAAPPTSTWWPGLFRPCRRPLLCWWPLWTETRWPECVTWVCSSRGFFAGCCCSRWAFTFCSVADSCWPDWPVSWCVRWPQKIGNDSFFLDFRSGSHPARPQSSRSTQSRETGEADDPHWHLQRLVFRSGRHSARLLRLRGGLPTGMGPNFDLFRLRFPIGADRTAQRPVSSSGFLHLHAQILHDPGGGHHVGLLGLVAQNGQLVAQILLPTLPAEVFRSGRHSAAPPTATGSSPAPTPAASGPAHSAAAQRSAQQIQSDQTAADAERAEPSGQHVQGSSAESRLICRHPCK